MRRIQLLILFVLIAQICPAQLTYQQVWVDYDSAWTFQNLQLIPIRYRGEGAGMPFYKEMLPSKYTTLSEGMRTGKVKVKEFITKGDADVHILSVINNTGKSILVNSGELLMGGKQDRMVGETKLIPPGKDEYYVTVYCVEEGRWAKRPRGFTHNGSADLDLRRTMDLTQHQAEIWKDISDRFKSQQMPVGTSAYGQLDRNGIKADSMYRNFFNAKMAKTDSAFAGFLAISGNSILGTELFVTPSLFNNAWESMLGTFSRTAISRGGIPSVDIKRMEVFMDALLENETSQKKTLAQSGKAYKYENLVIGLIAYGY